MQDKRQDSSLMCSKTENKVKAAILSKIFLYDVTNLLFVVDCCFCLFLFIFVVVVVVVVFVVAVVVVFFLLFFSFLFVCFFVFFWRGWSQQSWRIINIKHRYKRNLELLANIETHKVKR